MPRTVALRVTALCSIVSGLVIGLAGAALSETTPTPKLAAFTSQPLSWHACFAEPVPLLPPGHERLECATVTAPLDWNRAGDGRTVTLAISRLRPEHARARGVLLVNPGGPGGSGLLTPLLVLNRPTVADAYDIIGFDVRGTGMSSTLTCGSQSLSGNDPRDRSTANLDLIADTDAMYARYCAQHGDALLPKVTTEQTVKDLDLIRHLLGQRQFNWLGFSGGTWLGAFYATYFPQHVGHFVLDSNVDFTTSWQNAFEWQPLGFERRFREDFATWAASHDQTLHLGVTAEEVVRFYERVRADLSRAPVELPLLEALPLPDLMVTFDAVALDQTALNAMYSKDNFRWLAATMVDVRGRFDAARQSSAPSRDLALPAGSRRLIGQAIRTHRGGHWCSGLDAQTATFYAITCNDTPWTTGRRFWQQEAARQGSRYPLLGWYAVVNPCSTWSRPHAKLPVPSGQGVPPVLMVQSEHDPATPIEGARRVHERFAGSRMITVTGEGDHGLYLTGNPCVDNLVDQFLLAGQLPASDRSCAGTPIPDPGDVGPMEEAAPRSPILRNQWYIERAAGRIRV